MDLTKYLRDDFTTYIIPLVKKDRCEVCNSGTNLEVHHVYPFSFMVDDTLKELGLENKDVDEYTDIELLNIREKMIGKHLRYKYQTLCRDCHNKETTKQLKSDRFCTRNHSIFGFNKDGEVDKDLVPIIKELYSIYNQYSAKKCIEFISEYTDCYKSNASILKYMSNEKMVDVVGKETYNTFIQTKEARNAIKNKDILTNRTNWKYESLLYHYCGEKMTIGSSDGNTYFRCRGCIGRKNIQKNYSISKLENNLDIEIIKNMDNVLSETYKNSSQEEQKAILRQIIEKIIVHDYNNFEIIYK
jgi:5-methylcytosine-specific restriction endonuclease McrA